MITTLPGESDKWKITIKHTRNIKVFLVYPLKIWTLGLKLILMYIYGLKIERRNYLNETYNRYELQNKWVTWESSGNYCSSYKSSSFTFLYIYQVHAMNRIEKISNENPYCDDIPGFKKLTMQLEEIEEWKTNQKLTFICLSK